MMQNSTFNIQTVTEGVEEITKKLKYHRSDENFESVINSAKEIADRCRSSFSRKSKQEKRK
jgi:hypothetical protein